MTNPTPKKRPSKPEADKATDIEEQLYLPPVGRPQSPPPGAWDSKDQLLRERVAMAFALTISGMLLAAFGPEQARISITVITVTSVAGMLNSSVIKEIVKDASKAAIAYFSKNAATTTPPKDRD